MDKEVLRTGVRAQVTFEFMYRPEYLRTGTKVRPRPRLRPRPRPLPTSSAALAPTPTLALSPTPTLAHNQHKVLFTEGKTKAIGTIRELLE